ncbi:hypothetical protein O5853_28660, partial [Escherichia coli]|nr:hypothetical protein [Escherichia coli]
WSGGVYPVTPRSRLCWQKYPQAAPVADDVLVTFQHQPIGLAKRIGSRLKSNGDSK